MSFEFSVRFVFSVRASFFASIYIFCAFCDPSKRLVLLYLIILPVFALCAYSVVFLKNIAF